MEEELSFLRRKVNRLEDMIYNLNDKIGVILDKYFSRRANQIGSMRNVLQEEEDICLSLATQLKSCIIIGGGIGAGGSRVSAGPNRSGFSNIASATRSHGLSMRSPVPKVLVARLPEETLETQGPRPRPGPASKGRATRSSTATVNVPVSVPLPESEDPFDEPEDDGNDLDRSAIVNLKAEPIDEFRDEFQEVEKDTADVGDGDGQQGSGDSDESENSESSEEDGLGDLASKETDPDYLIIKPRERDRKPRPRKTPIKTYSKGRIFPSEDVARTQIKSEQQYEMESRRDTSQGLKLYYHCRADRKCPVKVHVIVDKNGVAQEYVCTDPSEHKHRKVIRIISVRGLTDEQKQVVHDIYVRGVTTPDQIKEQLEHRGFPDVRKHQISNYIVTLRKRLYGDLSFLKTTSQPQSASSGSSTEAKKKKRIRRRDLFEEEVEVMPGSSLLPSIPASSTSAADEGHTNNAPC